jgi:hypothetical protein
MDDDVTDRTTVRARLRNALPAAMKDRDMTAVAALRSTLGAIDNAEAVDAAQAPAVGIGDAEIANSMVGLGAGDVVRRVLTENQIAGIVRAEIADRRTAAADYERAGVHDRAERLRSEAGVLAAHLPDGA